MSKTRVVTALAAAIFLAAGNQASAADSSMFSVNGFGTIGSVHSSEKEADYVGTLFQPNGAGRTHSWSMGVDSKAGVQVRANLNDKLSALVQVVSQHQYDNSWRPMVEWANVKYQFTPQFSMRFGRIVLPSFLISESRLVGYSNAWVRPPEEVYLTSPLTNTDGADMSWSRQFGKVTNSLGMFYGTATTRGPTYKAEGTALWGINDTIEVGNWTLRASYDTKEFDLDIPNLAPVYRGLVQLGGALAQFGFTTEAAQALAINEQYGLDDIHTELYSLGANYDPGQWFVMGELVKYDGDSIVGSRDGFYVTAGYRVAAFTPYATYARVKEERSSTTGISTAGLPAPLAGAATQLGGGVNQTLASVPVSQSTTTLGVRWDFLPNADLKAQFERKNLLDNTKGSLSNPTSNFKAGGDLNVISIAVNFVF